jgi:uncharacterized membrane protein
VKPTRPQAGDRIVLETGFSYLAVLVAVAGGLKMAERRWPSRLFEYLPPIVLLYLTVMLLSTVGLWQKTASVNAVYAGVKDNVLPAMIFLMLLKSDLRQIRRLGPRMLGGFFAASISIGCGFIVAFALLREWLGSEAWRPLGALSGSWMGGTGNMVALQQALNVDDSMMGYALLIDSIDYALWVALLLALVPFATRFNRWTRATTDELDTIGARLEKESSDDDRGPGATSLLFLLGLALLVSALSQETAAWMPTTAFITTTSWTVIIVTLIGIAGAQTRLGKLAGSVELSSLMLYVIVALVGSRADLAELALAPLYIVTGLLILLVHGSLMVVIAKLFRLDLFTCGVASLANIGGVASAPILAAAYSRVLIPVGVLMALLGYVVGTAGGLLVARVLSMLA